MTGIFKPDRRTLTAPDLAAYRLFYCSLCDALHRGYGAGAAFLLQSDIVWLLLCLDNRDPAAAVECNGCCRCLANPLKHRRIVAGHPLFTAAADLSAFVIRLKIIDDRIDRRPDRPVTPASLCRRWMMGRVSGWIRVGENRMQITDDQIESILRTDHRTDLPPDDRIRPLTEWLGGVFEKRLAMVPGACIDGCIRTILRETIRILYLVDALEDFCADRRDGRSNILSGLPLPLRQLPVYVTAMVKDSASRIRDVLVPGPHRSILGNILSHVTGNRLSLATRRFDNAFMHLPQEVFHHEIIQTGLLRHPRSFPGRIAGGHQAPLPGAGPAIPPGPPHR